MRVAAAGEVVWRAELPPGDDPDAFVGAGWTKNKRSIQAWTWSSFWMIIDRDTGAIRSQTFTK
jgi:hypothetical protein